MLCIFVVLIFSAISESFNLQVKEGRIIKSPNNAVKDGNKSSYFGEFLHFYNENARLRLIVSSPRSTRTNFSLNSNPAFGQLYSCPAKLDLLTNPCEVLLANQNWSYTSGLTIAIDTSQGHKVACNFNNESTCLPTLVTSSGSCRKSSEQDQEWQLLRSKSSQDCSHISTLDIIFVLDGSGSVGLYNFNIVKNWVKEVSKDFDIKDGKTRVAVIQYSSYDSNRPPSNQSHIKTEIGLGAVRDIQEFNIYKDEGTKWAYHETVFGITMNFYSS